MLRHVVVPVVIAGVVIGAVSCSSEDDGAFTTLPPIRTTSTSSTSTTSTLPDGQRQFYEIKPGETLSMIARQFQVPLQAIIDLNAIANPDDVPAGMLIEIPTGVLLVTELPQTPSTETTAA